MPHRIRCAAAFSALLVASPIVLAQAPAQSPAQPKPAAQLSQAEFSVASNETAATSAGVRIVRLSQVIGQVKLDRNIARGFEPAFLNMPITQGSRVRTDVGAAEIEFEDNSSLRLTPDTVVEFTQLSRDPVGHTVSTVKVLCGTVYMSLANVSANAYNVVSKHATLVPARSSHFEFHVGSVHTSLSVFEGSVAAQAAADSAQAQPQPVTVSRKKTLIFDPASPSPTVVSHVDKGPYDAWDKNAVDYHQRYMSSYPIGGSATSGGLPVYGYSDLNYYGSFANYDGCGSLWRPYFAGASWDPYSNGMWALYDGAGYSWVSPYPWGWTPFHSGSWMYCSGSGWGWQPGGTFTALTNGRLPVLVGKNPIHVGRPPLPAAKSLSLIVVNEHPLNPSLVKDENTIVFNRDSAGLGVPRQYFGNLAHASTRTIARGSFTVTNWSAASSLSPTAVNGFPSNSRASSSTQSGSIANASSHGSTASSGGTHR